MQRKVIQIANSTQLISLPRKWALAHGIKKGDALEIEENGNKLIVSTSKGAEVGSVEVEVGDLDRDSLQFLIRALYKNGYDEIKLRTEKNHVNHLRLNKKINILDVITQEVSRLPGMDIFSQQKECCTIKSITEDSPKALDNILRRVFLLTIETMNDLHIGFKDGDKDVLDTIQMKHDNITKFVTYSQRILNKFGYKNLEKNGILYHILEVIDEIVDLLKFTERLLNRFPIKASEMSVKINEKIIESFNLYYKLFYNFDFQTIYNLNKNRYETSALLNKASKELSKKELMILAYLGQIPEKIMNLTVSTMSLNY